MSDTQHKLKCRSHGEIQFNFLSWSPKEKRSNTQNGNIRSVVTGIVLRVYVFYAYL